MTILCEAADTGLAPVAAAHRQPAGGGAAGLPGGPAAHGGNGQAGGRHQMTRSSRARLVAAAGLAAITLAAAGCGSAPRHAPSPVAGAPGVLSGSVTIGSYQPLTGAAAPGASEIAPASAAYFSYVNAHGGIYHRKIIYKYLNDQGRPALAPSIVHQLVQQDNVLAIFNAAGTAPHLAVTSFLNA
ncbi:MAG TPA: hypothetical protein DHU96_31205, partial [Actinobacteria bacterium]|nr:hypothetical protein [Actinomycetota bacterium]